ncbi:MAG: aminotransferase class I/II-fold pyridoxal phosphate-dependent enzyme, partial [Planctomycetota bacterium]
TAKSKSGVDVSLHGLWSRRQSTKFNGISYIVSRGCEAVFSDAGKQQVTELVGHYMANAGLLRTALTEQGMTVYGGVDAPYVWVRCPEGETSWQTFDRLLHEHHLVCTPGSGFGQAGEGYVRLSAFNSRANVEEAVHRLG